MRKGVEGDATSTLLATQAAPKWAAGLRPIWCYKRSLHPHTTRTLGWCLRTTTQMLGPQTRNTRDYQRFSKPESQNPGVKWHKCLIVDAWLMAIPTPSGGTPGLPLPLQNRSSCIPPGYAPAFNDQAATISSRFVQENSVAFGTKDTQRPLQFKAT
jgi:hypothetical protein|uniref:Uncharacterized protein n=1 Tax=Eutreptiella gymnastica TaxID=73025 RepID=A0A7S4D139_9EUGL